MGFTGKTSTNASPLCRAINLKGSSTKLIRPFLKLSVLKISVESVEEASSESSYLSLSMESSPSA